jgi:hypothetical protein
MTVMKHKIIKHLPIEPVSPLGKHCFFGYFDKYPWDQSQRFLLAHQTDFMARQPTAGEKAVIGMIDLKSNNEFIPLGETVAWCWQQGAMLQWLNDDADKIIYNDCEGDHFIANILDIKTGEKQTICRPIYCLSPDGRYALSVDFSLLDNERPGYGYPGLPYKFTGTDHSDNDGIWLVDLKQNTTELIISYAQLVKEFHLDSMDGVANWFNHLLFSPNSQRFAFFHRWRTEQVIEGKHYAGHTTRMFTANIDGSDIYPLNLDDMSSHYSWINEQQLINYSRRFGYGDHYYLYTDKCGDVEIIGKDAFDDDGHCSYSLDQRWMLTDCYPSEANGNHRSLYIFDLTNDIRYEIGKFYSDPTLPIPTRCDLHPNWSRDCRKVCIDSIHEGYRGVYIIDLSELISD